MTKILKNLGMYLQGTYLTTIKAIYDKTTKHLMGRVESFSSRICMQQVKYAHFLSGVVTYTSNTSYTEDRDGEDHS
jgi:hypothetical protein